MKLHAAIREHDDHENRVLWARVGVDVADRHGQRRGRRQDAMARAHARRGGH